ncbi:branched chain amino acid ABC transporter ATPase [Klebsiella pneumoniae]|nr:branched chain amino acid ABC transporter ATPase [Klebsiella pneumoniae]STV78256.1 branched chain amino acid ABC transporter ATPase [Klebsiella pneumoniae]
MSQPLLAFNEVDVFYGPIQALKQVSLTVNEGGDGGADRRQRRR